MSVEDIIKQMFVGLLLATLLLVLLALQGCKAKQIVVPEYHSVYVNKHDTLTKHDSIYQRWTIAIAHYSVHDGATAYGWIALQRLRRYLPS